MQPSIWIRFVFMGLLFVGLSACSSLDPFVDARREAGQIAQVGTSTNDHPVICYGLNKPEKIEWLAQNECAKTNRKAVFLHRENFSCSLFKPRKAIYQCVETTQSVPTYQSPCDLKKK